MLPEAVSTIAPALSLTVAEPKARTSLVALLIVSPFCREMSVSQAPAAPILIAVWVALAELELMLMSKPLIVLELVWVPLV